MKLLTAFLLLLSWTGCEAFVAPSHNTMVHPRAAGRLLKRGFAPKPLEDLNNKLDTNDETKNRMSTQPTPVLANPRAWAVAGTALLLSASSALPAFAAMSGGRMGGSFGAAPRVSAPRMRSGGYRGGGGYGGGYYGMAPRSPMFFAPPPVILGPPPLVVGPGVSAIGYSRGFSPLPFLLLGSFGFLFLSSVFRAPSIAEGALDTLVSGKSSVVKLSVALQVPNRDDPNSILSVLYRMANTAQTDSRRGVQNLTSQVALELLRRKNSIASASLTQEKFNDIKRAERSFNNVAVRERSKFEKESVSSWGGSRNVSQRVARDNDKATMAVVTLVLSLEGDEKLPKINSIGNVEEILRTLAADVKVDDKLYAAEILWTPEDRAEILTRQEIVSDYPELIDV